MSSHVLPRCDGPENCFEFESAQHHFTKVRAIFSLNPITCRCQALQRALRLLKTKRGDFYNHVADTSRSQNIIHRPQNPEGKRKASLNALRHGLTGRVVVLPSEDMNACHAFCAELTQDLKPEGAIEKQYAQTFCDTQWRLNRIRSVEDSMLALGLVSEAEVDPGHPEIRAALINAQVFREQSKQFANLSLYEQRLNRALKESLRQLKELQAERTIARQTALAEAVAIRNLKKQQGEPYDPAVDQPSTQFVFSTSEIEAESRRQYFRSEIEKARRHRLKQAA
ncbi:MAG TPA: hypothetical protein VK789_09050 [Bryobacteraceae bacterium]|nr:hypothetical protein [Bryobacteraceae bacterium]